MPHAALKLVTDRIAAAARASGREARDITLIAVSKTFEQAAIRPVIDSGQMDFGENRVQEASGKWPELLEGHRGLKLHLIGPLQTNKAREAVALFDAIHSLDRPKLAAALAAEMGRLEKTLQLFIQVNTGDERQKAGVSTQHADRFIDECRGLHQLTISGLMCIPPVDEPPERHFALLARLAERHGLTQLSMGMSGDFERAIACGATHVRVGSAIFGNR
jgi:PLP dependent protein